MDILTAASSSIDAHEVPEATEPLVAQWLQKMGRKIIRSDGRSWLQIAPGFYQPVCLLTASSKEKLHLSHFALGWRAALHTDDARLANGSIPVYLRNDIRHFSISDLSSKCRNTVKKGLKNGRFQRLTDPRVLWSQGYPIYRSFFERTHRSRGLSLRTYQRDVETLFDEWHIVIAAFTESKLAGYIDGYSVNGVGYGEYFVLSPEARSLGLGSALLYHMINALKQSGKATRMMNGLQTPEIPQLADFKRHFGFVAVEVPAVVETAWGVRQVLGALSPSKAFRFFGSPKQGIGRP